MKKQQTIFGEVKKVGKGVVTITFGDSGENHVGNQMIGQKVELPVTMKLFYTLILYY